MRRPSSEPRPQMDRLDSGRRSGPAAAARGSRRAGGSEPVVLRPCARRHRENGGNRYRRPGGNRRLPVRLASLARRGGRFRAPRDRTGGPASAISRPLGGRRAENRLPSQTPRGYRLSRRGRAAGVPHRGPDGRTNVPAPKVAKTGGKPAIRSILDLAIGRFSLERGHSPWHPAARPRFPPAATI